MKARCKTVFVIGLMLVVATAGAAGKTYRWVDAQGKVHYGDQPPPNAVEVSKSAPDASASPAPAAPQPGALSAEECQRRQKQLESYRNAATITETDALGNHRDYSEDDRQKLIARTEQAIRDGCPN